MLSVMLVKVKLHKEIGSILCVCAFKEERVLWLGF